MISPTSLRVLLRAGFMIALLLGAGDMFPQVTQTFTSSGTFTVPAGVTQVTVECWGGGGRGGTLTSAAAARGGGGGGGAYSRSVLTVTPGSNHTVTVGAGSTSTSAGGDSWFGSAATVLAKGGNSCANNSSTGATGGTAAASIGTVKFSGGTGANAPGSTGGGGGSSAGTAANGANGAGQSGGTAPAGGGDGGNGANGFVAAGNAGSAPGGGGGGAERGCCITANGGSGANGQVLVTYTPCATPVISATTSNSPICPGATLTLGATVSGATSLLWSGTGTFSPNNTSASVSVTGAAAGTYTITATNSCGSVNADVVVTVNPAPTGVTASSSAASVCSTSNTVDLSSTVNAPPATVLSQDFNSGISPWTTTNSSTGGTPANAAWTARADGYQFNAYDGLVTFSSNDASQFALSNSDAQGGGTTATTLVSPVFSTVGYTALSLSYYHHYRYNSGADDRARVEISINGGSSWTTVETHSSTQGATSGFVQSTIDLTSYVGEANARLRFRYDCSWDWWWALDNVVLSGTPAANTFAWTSAPAGFTSSAQNPTGVAVTASTVYTVTVTGPNGCTTAANTSVTYTPAPSATISYAGSPYCAAAGIASVTHAGSTGGTYSATPAGLVINAGNGEVTLGSSTPGTYTVTYTIAASGGCALYSTNTGITVDAASTLYADTDGDGFGDPATTTTGCPPLAGYVTNNTDNCPSVFGLIGDACDDGNANTVNDQLNGSCVCAGTNAPWYSQGNGTFADPIWSHNIAGPGAAATLDAGSIVVIQSGHAVSITTARDVQDLSIEATASLSLGSNALTVHGTSVDIDGTLNGGTGELSLEPSAAATLDGSGTLDLHDLTIDAPAGLNCLANAPIRGTLLLVDGAFTATGTVSLVSNATTTGRLGPVGASASYVGNLTVNRYIPAGATNWRMMGSPVAGRTVNDWKDDFYTAGFPGSHSPGFSNPVGSGILWPSIRWYDETNAGPAVNDGLTGATGTAQALSPGQGFAAWCGTGYSTTTAFTVDVTGNPHVANTPIALPMSYTNTGVPNTDGWNMVSNPLASPIAFDQISRGADVADYITYFNPAMGNLATWDISDNLGTNGGSNTIQSSQAFWLKATGPAVGTTVSESAKVAGNTGGFFGGSEVQVANMIRLRIESAINQYSDETVVLFSSGEPAFNSSDVPKFIFAHPDAPQIASVGDGGEMMAINAYGPYSEDISIPVTVDVAINGQYSIVATGLHNMGLSCVRLEDLATGIITPLIEGATYSFTALATDDINEPRFLLRASAPVSLTATDASCSGRDDGSASALITSGPVDVIWYDADGIVLLEQNNVMPGTADLVALEAGSYSVSIGGVPACATISTTFTIEEPAGLEVEADTEISTCPESADGHIDLTVLGGTAPYQYLWSNEATTEDIEVGAGSYSVLVTDANGCTFEPQTYVVGSGEGPDAGIGVESFIVNVGEEVLFAPNTLEGVNNSWDFGDGSQSNELEPVHSFDEPGTYTVTLLVDDGTCTGTASVEIQVQTSTGITNQVGKDLNAYVSGDRIVIDHDFGSTAPVLIRVYSTGGQLAQEHRVSSAPARITLPTDELATGIWLVRVSSGETMRTFSLPVVH
ncbi:MAG: PKD domain-containing protein [Flavobacteriales bacterium]